MLENWKCMGKSTSVFMICVSSCIKTCQLDQIYWKGHTNGYDDRVSWGFFVDTKWRGYILYTALFFSFSVLKIGTEVWHMFSAQDEFRLNLYLRVGSMTEFCRSYCLMIIRVAVWLWYFRLSVPAEMKLKCSYCFIRGTHGIIAK